MREDTHAGLVQMSLLDERTKEALTPEQAAEVSRALGGTGDVQPVDPTFPDLWIVDVDGYHVGLYEGSGDYEEDVTLPSGMVVVVVVAYP